MKSLISEDLDFKEVYEAADSGNWASYTELMGGVFCKRKEQQVRPHYDIEVNKDTGLVKSSFFDGVPVMKLKGIVHKGREIITRIHQWRVERRFEKAGPAFSPLLGVL